MDHKQKIKDVDGFSPHSLEKGAVLQEVRIFSGHPLNPKACYSLLSRILWVIMHGEAINKKESTDLFFAVTKLFQNKDIPLRRMVYIVLKELSKISDDVLIAIAILTKDMAGNLEPFKANAIRVISRVVDTTMISQVERNIKQSIVHAEPYVASCALVSGIHLIHRSPDVVKRWVSEVQEAMNSRSGMVRYHALALMQLIRQSDPMAISKLVHTVDKNSLRSPLAHILLIRMACKLLADQPPQNRDPVLFHYVDSCLHFSSDMVVFEAAKQIANLPNITAKELETVLKYLQPLLLSGKAPQRYAAVRVIHKVALSLPAAITTNLCFDLTNLISDSNRSISTMAVMTLLQVEKENSIGKLLKEIAKFVSDIPDDFRVSVVDGIRALATKYPSQHAAIMQTLSSMLRAEAGFDYKRRIVDSFLEIIHDIPESKDYALAYLCEYIEDCEFTYLSTKILNLLGQEGPHCTSYAFFIRYIYNRIILEKAAVRASALTALSRYSTIQPEVIKILLKQCIHDNDDQVRDKATFFLNILENLPSEFMLFSPTLSVPLDNLDSALMNYIHSSDSQSAAFDISNVSTEIQTSVKPVESTTSTSVTTTSAPSMALDLSNVLASTEIIGTSTAAKIGAATSPAEISSLFPNLGPVFKTTAPIPLTEPETEYQVVLFKHIFPQTLSVVLQFNVVNTLADRALCDIRVDVKPLESSRVAARKIRLAQNIPWGSQQILVSNPKPNSPTHAVSYVVLNLHEELRASPLPISNVGFSAVLKFGAIDVLDNEDPIYEGAVEDEYPLDSFNLSNTDNIKRVNVSNWASAWESMNPESGEWHQHVVPFSLATAATLPDAVNVILQLVGCQPCGGTEEVPPKRSKHILEMAGLHMSGARIIGRARMMMSPNNPGVTVELTIRSSNPEICVALASTVLSA